MDTAMDKKGGPWVGLRGENEAMTALTIPLPGDIARRKAIGDLEGALRLIDVYLSRNVEPELVSRLLAERVRLERLPKSYPYTRGEAIAMMREEWPDLTEEQFDALVDGGRIDWRYIHGEMRIHSAFLGSLRLYPKEAAGLKPEPPEDTTKRDALLERMERVGHVKAEITIKATIRPKKSAKGKQVQAWLPIPAACSQQSNIEILSATEGGVCAPLDAPQRTIWWDSTEEDSFSVTYRYTYNAVWTDPTTIVPDPVQPDFDTEEELPHLAFTPYLRALAARITDGCNGPVEKAAAIYDYVTGTIDYRFQPAYLQLESIADTCARERRGDCGVMALLFVALCRISGIPAQWESGLAVYPDRAGCHDWAKFYIAPHGWLWADCSFGSSSRRRGEDQRRRHYFGSLDPWRMVANRACFAPLTPPDPAWRMDPYDNQLGEMTVDGRGLDSDEMERTVETVSFAYR